MWPALSSLRSSRTSAMARLNLVANRLGEIPRECSVAACAASLSSTEWSQAVRRKKGNSSDRATRMTCLLMISPPSFVCIFNMKLFLIYVNYVVKMLRKSCEKNKRTHLHVISSHGRKPSWQRLSAQQANTQRLASPDETSSILKNTGHCFL